MAQANSPSCIFCNIPDERIVLANACAVAIDDGFPLTQGHLLVIPRRHIRSLFELTTDELIAVFDLLEQAKARLEGRYAPDGYNVGVNDGAAAGQTVMHLHVHLIPRYRGDSPDPRGGVRWIMPDKAPYWEKKDE